MFTLSLFNIAKSNEKILLNINDKKQVQLTSQTQVSMWFGIFFSE